MRKNSIYTLLIILFYSSLWGQDLQNGLIVYYKFDGNALDASGNGNHTTANATLTADRFGNSKSAYSFNGVDEYIDLPNIPALKPDLPLSVSFWVWFDDLDLTNSVVFTTDFAQNKHSGINMSLSANNPAIAIAYGDGTNTNPSSRRTKLGTTPIKAKTWYYVVVTISGPQDMAIYIKEFNSGPLCSDDGGSYSGTGGPLAYTGNPGSIGRNDSHGQLDPYYFKGKIDEFKMWNRALTADEITEQCAIVDPPSSNEELSITAIGDQIYCPLTQQNIVTDFSISNPGQNPIDAIYIQVSEGYVRSQDRLSLSGTFPGINASWSSADGKLSITSTTGNPIPEATLVTAIKNVVYESNSIDVEGTKQFSITIGDANYLPETGHYYQFISSVGISWHQAKTEAATLTYYGLNGYLATLTSEAEARFAGKQSQGTGWIGGTDEVTEGVWKWATGPEAGDIFWNGGPSGSSPAGQYAFWNNGEPNNLGGEHYAHITAPNVGITGSWNDLPPSGTTGDYEPKGYIVEYGWTDDAPLDIATSTKLTIPEITTTENYTSCGPALVELKALASAGEVLWFDSPTSDTPLFTGGTYTPNPTTTTDFYVLASGNGCTTGKRTKVTATINPVPIIQSSITLKNCDEDGVPDGYTDYNLTEASTLIYSGVENMNFTYYLSQAEAQSASNAVTPSPYNNRSGNTVYVRVENEFGCFQIATIQLEVSTTSFHPDFVYHMETCEDDELNDGQMLFDLTQASQIFIDQFPTGQQLSVHYYRNLADAQLEQNEITDQRNFKSENALNQTLFVRVESLINGDCFGIGPHLELTVHLRPEVTVPDTVIWCSNLPSFSISVDNPDPTLVYEWFDEFGNSVSSDNDFQIAEAGLFQVVSISENGCVSFPQTVTVTESVIANITMGNVTVVENSDNNSITIHNEMNQLGVGDYEFALNDPDGDYQTEPYFDGLIPGIYTLYVRDRNDCGLAQLEIPILGFPKFFTPNNDGHNDKWQVKGLGLDYVQNSVIHIFDRFGKSITVFKGTDLGWDGSFNGELLPSTDYWFTLHLSQDQNGIDKIFKGHFSLIRR